MFLVHRFAVVCQDKVGKAVSRGKVWLYICRNIGKNTCQKVLLLDTVVEGFLPSSSDNKTTKALINNMRFVKDGKLNKSELESLRLLIYPTTVTTVCASGMEKHIVKATSWRWKRFYSIYPSQRQNLLPTLEISYQNFQNFHNFQNFRKKIPKSRVFFQNFQKHKGAATDIKGAAGSSLPNYKIFIFFKSFQSSGYIT